MSSQEDSIDVSDEAKRLVSEIIAKNSFKETCKIKYYPGSEAGDGYSTKTYAVDITDGERSLNLFLKCALNIEHNISFAHMIYATEIYFYKTIYPAYKELLESKGVKDGFQDVPVCYGYNDTRRLEILAFENLKKRGYTLFDKFTCMNDEHLRLTLQSFAKFHAISFAMKDQRKDLHDEFCGRCPNVFAYEDVVPKSTSNAVKAFIEILDPIEDKNILDRCDNLAFKVFDRYLNVNNYLTDYSILIKCDCWVNNMMVLYENNDREHPKSVMLVDWQCVTRASPVHDIGALFYSVATKEAVGNYKHYLQIYHKELSKRIKELGSDPEVLYPLSVFEKEWIDYGLCSLGLCLQAIKVMLSESTDLPTLDNSTEKIDVADMFKDVPYNEEEYLRRTKYVVRHMIDIGIL